VPLHPEQNFDSVRDFARSVAGWVVARDPDQYALEQYKKKRAVDGSLST
jgi:DNA primase